MIVTGIEEQTKTKFKVYLDGTFAFVLYKGELKRFGIKQGEDLAQENYEGGTISGECNQRSN